MLKLDIVLNQFLLKFLILTEILLDILLKHTL